MTHPLSDEAYTADCYEERIRELEAEFNDLSAHYHKVKAELAFYKGFHDGVCRDKTHVVVPVEPTEEMYSAMRDVFDDDGSVDEVYRAMIRAAQTERQQGE